MASHIPVLLQETLELLAPRPSQTFIDCTAGGGGHLGALADRVGPEGKVLGIEWDEFLWRDLQKRFKERTNVKVVNGSYARVQEIASTEGVTEADGILFDLGFSSWHQESSGRGFSFLREEPLDMRYSTHENPLSAREIVRTWNRQDLERILREYGQERFARKIAEGICRQRERKEIATSKDLAEVVRRSVPPAYRHGRIHCATRTFQALRIAVNGEMENLRSALPQAVELLSPGGTVAVISFHSVEDRIVKNFFRESDQLEIITKKPLTPSEKERSENPRARSAKLRGAHKKHFHI